MRHDDDPFDPALRDAIAEYHQPDVPPRQEMWLRVQETRAMNRAGRRRKQRLMTWPLLWAGGIAAGLVMGVGVGRVILSHRGTVAAPATPDVVSIADTVVKDGGTNVVDSVVGPSREMALARAASPRKRARSGPRGTRSSVEPVLPAGLPSAYRVTMAEHLGNAEVFLTLFRFSVERGAPMIRSAATARELLSTNRVLLDSPAGKERAPRALLEDLEFVLARIVQVSSRPQTSELEVIATGLEEGGMMTRLRSEVPAGPFAVGQGGL